MLLAFVSCAMCRRWDSKGCCCKVLVLFSACAAQTEGVKERWGACGVLPLPGVEAMLSLLAARLAGLEKQVVTCCYALLAVVMPALNTLDLAKRMR